MTREEAIEYLHKLFMQAEITDEYGDMDDTEPYETAIDMAVEALKFRGAYEIAVKAANKAFENRWTQWVEWILCSERLPDSNGEYLVTTKDGEVYQDTFQFLCQWDDNKDNVIAWMSLPKPYQEDNQ